MRLSLSSSHLLHLVRKVERKGLRGILFISSIANIG